MIFWNKEKRKKRKTSSQKPVIQPSKKSSTLERKPYTPPQRKSPENHSTKNISSKCAISNAVDKSHYEGREKCYLSIIKKYNKNEQEIFPELLADTVMALEANPEQDFLGHIFMSLNLGNECNGQFFTPYHVCELMAKITTDNVVREIHDKGFITVNDPCCGAGATLIAGIHEIRKKLEKEHLNFQNHVLVSGQDIEEVVALMCYIQLSLLGVAAYIKVGNSLTEPMVENDSTENYWFTPIYFSDVWVMRRTIKKFNQIMKGEESKK